MSKNEQFTKIFEAAKINTRRVSVIGSFVHIDTFQKYENALRDVMGNAGFKLLQMNAVHLDGVHGFRMVFVVR